MLAILLEFQKGHVIWIWQTFYTTLIIRQLHCMRDYRMNLPTILQPFPWTDFNMKFNRIFFLSDKRMIYLQICRPLLFSEFIENNLILSILNLSYWNFARLLCFRIPIQIVTVDFFLICSIEIKHSYACLLGIKIKHGLNNPENTVACP